MVLGRTGSSTAVLCVDAAKDGRMETKDRSCFSDVWYLWKGCPANAKRLTSLEISRL